MVVAELFSKQRAPWKEMTNDISDLIVRDADATVNLILQHVVDKETATALLRIVVGPAMDAMRTSLTAKVSFAGLAQILSRICSQSE
jgi:hypothetical protein